jgi:hypothetical protein
VRLRLQLGFGRPGLVIYENKNQLEIANVFAGLLTVTLIGRGSVETPPRWSHRSARVGPNDAFVGLLRLRQRR